MNVKPVDLLIIGAGPFGLAVAATADRIGLDYKIFGKPMEFWRSNMPEGMYLRSDCEWHLDPLGEDTIKVYLKTKGLTPADVEPLSRKFYLEYLDWFVDRKKIDIIPEYVLNLEYNREHNFTAETDKNRTISTKNVVIALGFKYFKNEPEELVKLLPTGRFSHTCEHVDFDDLSGKRCLIIGGRQSAFEWAALLQESGTDVIHIVHRHESPAFEIADWSWVPALVDGMVENPTWFRNLSAEQQESVNHKLWAEGRLKVEPWLEPRILKKNVHIWPEAKIVSCSKMIDNGLQIKLDNGESLEIDHVILATGYRFDVTRIPFLKETRILKEIHVKNNFPVLDAHFQSSIPGLFFTSLAATQDFGPFFGFTVSVRSSAKLIGNALMEEKFK